MKNKQMTIMYKIYEIIYKQKTKTNRFKDVSLLILLFHICYLLLFHMIPISYHYLGYTL